MAMNVEKEIADLKRRVAELEGSFGYISGQLREVQLFLHNNVDARLTSLEGKVETGFARMDTRFDALETKLPGIVAGAVGEALRTRE
jgi:hypothetical protein